MIIAIDFDGTIVEHKYPLIGEIREDAVEVINRLAKKHEIIIWTCRGSIEDISATIDFLKDNKVKFHGFNQPSKSTNFETSRKIFADIYIDDRQIGDLPSWIEIENIINKIENGNY
jgi:hydroxymethylpyrimidine pyrophosphatase-like HAD family hydrolase